MKLFNPYFIAAVALSACVANLALADEEADHDALRKIKAVYEHAVNANTVDAFDEIRPHLAADFTGVMLTGESVTGFEAMRAYWAKMLELIGKGGSYQAQVNVDRSEFFGDIALSRGLTEEVVVSRGRTFNFQCPWTSVCRRENGEWKVVRVHASMDPVSNPFVKRWLSLARVSWGVGGLVVGFLISLMVRLLSRRRSSTRVDPNTAGHP